MYEKIMEILDKRMLFAEELSAPFACSVGCHIANLFQRESKRDLFVTKGIKEDIRLPIAIISPAGLSKSYTMRQFADPTFGILPFKSKFTGKITEAGLIGTVQKGETILGQAYKMRDGFLCFNELSSLFFTAQSEHSSELVNQVLEILSEGSVHKDLASGSIDYKTDITIWGGTQFTRFDFSQGLGRRFLFVTKDWSDEDILALKEARRQKGKSLDTEAEKVREGINNLRFQFDVEEIRFEDKLMEYLIKEADTPSSMQKYEKMLIGRSVLDWDGSNVLKVGFDNGNKALVNHAIKMEMMVAEGGDLSMILNLLSKGPKNLEYLWNMGRKFGYTLEKFLLVLNNSLQKGVIRKVVGERNTYESRIKRGY